MAFMGLIGLLVAFAATVISLVCLVVGQVLQRHIAETPARQERSELWSWGGRLAVVVGQFGLLFCCGLLVYCFMTGDTSIQYVVQNRSDATGTLGWLYKLSGLWAGRQGSLLFWAWLISLFNTVVVFRVSKRVVPLDNMALLVSQIVLAAFVSVMLFSEDNMPFIALAPQYFTASGALTGAAAIWGMNTLLEHWAMAIHPPTLFIGYAGLTIPFAYGIGSLIVNDDSRLWVDRCTTYALFSWLFLGLGIGLGAVWAYVVLGWGGYWGWDAVENASLLPWVVGVALIHSFTVYRQRGAFKRWSVLCACITFSFVILGTFITRSGLVQSVHAFEGDPVSLVLFLGLIILSLTAGIIGLIARHKTFGVVSETDEMDSLVSKDGAYYVNNLILIVFACLLAYMTISSALPSFLPFGGQALTAGTYNAVARPLGILYCLLIAVCPLLAWGKTNPTMFWKRARVPGICALVLFVLLMIYFGTYLLPSYQAIIDSGGTSAQGLLEQGAPLYYNGLAVVGFAAASLLVFNAGFMFVRLLRPHTRVPEAVRETPETTSADNPDEMESEFAQSGEPEKPIAPTQPDRKPGIRRRFSALGGSLSHFATGIILVGLICSSMYVTEKSEYLPYDESTDTASERLAIQDFELEYTGNTIELQDNNDDVIYTLYFDVYRNGSYVGSVAPAVQLVQSNQQQKLIASTLTFPEEDLFVVYRGVNDNGDFSLDVRVNPMINLVWIGFALLMVGTIIALFTKRRS